jgi:hypothetical protein
MSTAPGARVRLAMLALTLISMTGPAWAGDAWLPIDEWGLRTSGGTSFSGKLVHIAVLPWAGFTLWESADRWFADRDVRARWVVEPWVAFVHDRRHADGFEIGVSPLAARLTFGDATLRPFVEGGEGILYTNASKNKLGIEFQFSSQIGVGLEYEIRPDLAFTLGARLRHISNAGIAHPNHGISSASGILGITFR